MEDAMTTIAVILAAGQGTRMKSDLPKVLHRAAGKALVRWAMDAATAATGERPVVVVGHGADAVRAVVGADGTCVLQAQQLGTANAVQAAEGLCAGKTDLVLVTSADMPLLTGETLSKLIAAQRSNPGPISMLTVKLPDSHGFGRIVRGADGSVRAIVEEAQASDAEKAIRELNVGAYCFRADWLWQALRQIPVSPKGEYYLTDTVALAVKAGMPVIGIPVADPTEAIGINTRVHLAEAEGLLRMRINTRHMLAGVTLIDPGATYIEDGVEVGGDTVIYPNTYLRGKTVIGSGCTIGPNTILEDTLVGNDCTLLAMTAEGAIIEDDVTAGPYGHLRKGAHLGRGAHMGNFGEIKNSYLAAGVKMGHFSYIGDATIGEDVNIGAGTITCNFDGEHKHPTVIGRGAFIGSDTMLVAPLTIGEGARTGAGAVVTHDVPDHTVVVGVPARALVKKRKKKAEKSE
jgi:bifunctional UDP-N-acetylglucosamine pyrophosphorylase/glucosamine-1-phosphate N-acetyltransferase